MTYQDQRSEHVNTVQGFRKLSDIRADVQLPLPPEKDASSDLEVYARFMSHVRQVPNSRIEIKVLSAIQFTADLLGHSDAQVAKLLVELGLRAPRLAFPAEFLDFADQCLVRDVWDVGGPSEAMSELQSYWFASGVDCFAGFNKQYPLHDVHKGALV